MKFDEMIIFTKFHEGMTKNVDFLLMAKFWMCLVSFDSDFKYSHPGIDKDRKIVKMQYCDTVTVIMCLESCFLDEER